MPTGYSPDRAISPPSLLKNCILRRSLRLVANDQTPYMSKGGSRFVILSGRIVAQWDVPATVSRGRKTDVRNLAKCVVRFLNHATSAGRNSTFCLKAVLTP